MRKKVIISLSIVIIISIMLCGLLFLKDDKVTIVYTDDEIKLKENYEKYNNVEYNNILLNEVNIDSDNNVTYTNEKTIKNLLTSGTNIIFFGDECNSTSRYFLPILISNLKKNNIDGFYYYDSKELKKKDIYKDILNTIYDEENYREMIIPTIMFIKDGKFIGLYDSDEFNEEELKEKLSYYIDKINPSVCSTDEKC